MNKDNKALVHNLSANIAIFRTTKINILNSNYVKTSEFSILMIINNMNKKISSIDISKYLNCSKAYASKVINSLINKKLINLEQNTDDKRQYFLSLTTSGKDLVDKYMDEYLKTTAYLYEKLGKEKSIELTNLLKDATLILKEYEDKTKGDK